jgi:tetratricopeptide (TPR) repeat protein
MQKTTLALLSFAAASSIYTAAFANPNAATAPDTSLRALLQADKAAEVVRITRERIAKDPNDEQAHRYLAMAAAEDKAKRADALKTMEACVARNAKSAVCHHGAGILLGQEAIEKGVMSAMGSVGKIKDYFVKATELDPQYFDARRELVLFYLMTPGIAGGSVKKAVEVANTTKNAEHMSLLKATVANYEKKYEESEKQLTSLKFSAKDELFDDWFNAMVGAGMGLANDKKDTQAMAIIDRLVQAAPERASPLYYRGALQNRSKQFDQALASLSAGEKLEGAGRFNFEWQRGQAFQGKGEKDKARAAYEKALAAPKVSERMKKNINEKLEELKS